jgi:hypothetical protein
VAEVDVDPRDLRFQYDVIKGQSDSIRSMAEGLLRQQETLSDIVERLVRIESNKVDSRVTTLEAEVEQLKAERNQRVGMSRLIELIFKSPLVGWLVGAGTAVWFLLSGKAQP